MLSKCEDELSGISEYSSEISALYDRLSAAKIEIQDISDELSGIADGLDIDQERFDYVISKYNSLNSLQRKYNCEYKELLEMYNESVRELSETEYSDEDIQKIIGEKDAVLHQVTDKAKKISAHRKKTAEIFIRKVTEELRFLDMPNVILDVKHETGKLTINGMDTIEFLISANKGETPKGAYKLGKSAVMMCRSKFMRFHFIYTGFYSGICQLPCSLTPCQSSADNFNH